MGEPILVKKLRDIQVMRGLSDIGMAKRLGCSRQLWQMTRTNKILPGKKVVAGISSAFPELHRDVIYFLSNNDKKLSNYANNPLRATSQPQGRGLKRFFVGLLGSARERLSLRK